MKKVQRIRMRIDGHPVWLDGTVTEFSKDGTTFLVHFDGPIPLTRFYPYRGALVSDKPKDEHGQPAIGSTLWEVHK